MIIQLKKDTIDSFLKDFLFLAFFCFLLYSSSIFIPFLQHDGYRYISTPITQCKWLTMLGRPLAAIIESVQGVVISSSRNNYFLAAAVFRGILVILMAFTAAIASVSLRKVINNKYLCLGIVCAVVTLPGFVNFVAMINISNILAILFAGLSYLFLECCADKDVAPRKRLLFFPASVCCIFISLFLYPILSFLFLIPTMVRILNGIGKADYKFIKFLLRDFIFLGMNSFIAYGIFRFLFTIKIGNYDNSIQFQRIITQLKAFVTSNFAISANLWNIYTSELISKVVLLFIVVLLVSILIRIYVSNRHKYSMLLNTLVRLGAVAAIFITVNFHLILFNNFLVYRVYLNYSIFLLLLSAVIIIKIYPKLSYLIIAFAVIGSFLALFNSTQNALNSYLEFKYAAAQINNRYTGRTGGVHFILSRTPLIGFNRLPTQGDGFNFDTTSIKQVDIKKFSRALFMYLGLPYHLKYSYSDYGKSFKQNKNIIVVDMNNIVSSVPVKDTFSNNLCYSTLPDIHTIFKKAFEPLDEKKIYPEQ